MDWNLQFETRVKGGMPVTVCCVFSPLSSEEYSDVEDLWLEVRGRRAKWIEKALTDAEWERLYAEAFENGQWPNDEELPGTKLTPERWEEIFIAPQIFTFYLPDVPRQRLYFKGRGHCSVFGVQQHWRDECFVSFGPRSVILGTGRVEWAGNIFC